MDATTAPYVWLAPAAEDRGDEVVARPSDDDDARVARWARARGATLVRPSPAPPAVPPIDPSVADAVEAAIAKARDALTALDVAAIESSLARAEALLREHPELPQAAWLRAEVERGWATRFARVEPRDEARAERAWKRAAALDGGRVAGVGESAFGAPELVPITIRLASARDADVELRVDGRIVAPGTVELGEAEHQIVARRGGRTLWAAWAGVAKGAVLTLPAFAPPACSAEDFARVRAHGGVVDASGVACERWFVVAGDGARIAQCRGDHCGAFVDLRAASAAGAAALGPTPAEKPEAVRGPAWLTWTAVGAAVLLTGGSLLYASGVFDKPDREQRWVAGGLRTE